MSDKDFTFVIFRNVKDGYSWRLRSASGETVDISLRGHRHKADCEQEVHRLRDDRYPEAEVRDLTAGRLER
jgi:uncharacterized protein YegP (UPF0339 family)